MMQANSIAPERFMALVESLLNLFRVDGQVRALRSRLDAAQRYLNTQTKQLSEVQQQQQELQTRRKHLQATVGTLEVELKAVDQRLEKLRGELNNSVNQRQYAAALHELTTVKEQRKKVEDRVLNEMQEVERIEQQLQGLQGTAAERTKLREHAQAQLQERQADVGQRLAELEAERSAAAAVIPAESLAVFDELADIYEGEAMAPIQEIDRRHREYACGACNMHVPFEQILNSTRSESLVRCPSCDRILFMQAETRGSLAKK